MSEEPSNISQTIGLVSVNGGIVIGKRLFEGVSPDTVQLAKAFADQTVKCRVRALLRTALYDHVHQFNLCILLDRYMRINIAENKPPVLPEAAPSATCVQLLRS